MDTVYKPRVFLSSPVKGLEDLRSILIEFFKNEKGYSPIYFGDKDSSGLTGKSGIVEQCLAGVHSSDAFFLIVDRRYGEPDQKDEDGNSISLTELEFIEALKCNVFIYVFCRNEVWIAHKIWKTNPDINFDFDERYDNPKHLMMFLTRIKEKEFNTVRFDEVADLKRKLSDIDLSVDSLKAQPNRIGENDNLEVSS